MTSASSLLAGALLAALVACHPSPVPAPPPAPSAPAVVPVAVVSREAGVVRAGPTNTLLLRFTMTSDPGSTGIVVPRVAELPDGTVVVAGTSYETNLGAGAERLADGFVAAFTKAGARQWLCPSSAPPDRLGVDAAGAVHVALSAACPPLEARAEGRQGPPKNGALWSTVEVVLDGQGAPRASTKNALGIPGVLRSALGDDGSLLVFGYGRPGVGSFALGVIDDAGKTRWSRQGAGPDGRDAGTFPTFAVSGNGSVAAFTGAYTRIIAGTGAPAALVKLDPRGALVWSDPMAPTEGPPRDATLVVHGIMFDKDDLVFLGRAARSFKVGGKVVPGSLFVARLDAKGAARWVHPFEKAGGVDVRAELLRTNDGGVIVATRSFGPATEGRERDLDLLLTRLDREGNETARRLVQLHDLRNPELAASVAGDAVVVAAAVNSAAQQEQLFPGSFPAPTASLWTILVGLLSLE